MLPLFRAAVKFCSTNRLFAKISRKILELNRKQHFARYDINQKDINSQNMEIYLGKWLYFLKIIQKDVA